MQITADRRQYSQAAWSYSSKSFQALQALLAFRLPIENLLFWCVCHFKWSSGGENEKEMAEKVPDIGEIHGLSWLVLFLVYLLPCWRAMRPPVCDKGRYIAGLSLPFFFYPKRKQSLRPVCTTQTFLPDTLSLTLQNQPKTPLSILFSVSFSHGVNEIAFLSESHKTGNKNLTASWPTLNYLCQRNCEKQDFRCDLVQFTRFLCLHWAWG